MLLGIAVLATVTYVQSPRMFGRTENEPGVGATPLIPILRRICELKASLGYTMNSSSARGSETLSCKRKGKQRDKSRTENETLLIPVLGTVQNCKLP